MKLYSDFTSLIGNTPLVELKKISSYFNLNKAIIGKLESINPAGSAKDRVAFSMLNDAEQKGLIKKGSVIIEPTSGNTGIGLAAICAQKGYKAIFVMPETMSIERRNLLKAYGAEIVLTDGKLGMTGSIEKAYQLLKEIDGSFIPGQFDNPANSEIHYKTTGPEIWNDTDGQVDIFVAGVGTGGTISGVGKFLKEKNPDVKIIAVEPYNSAVLSGENAGAHGLQGIGAGFIPKILNTEIIDEIVKVKEQDAYMCGKAMAYKEGLLVGISSGAALWTAVQVAKQPENHNKNIVVLLPDTGERYLSTPMFE